MPSSSSPRPDLDGLPRPGPGAVALVLGGGNALGAYLAGAYERLHEQGVRPERIVGASIGAVTGAILAGNPPERRLERLQAFWAEAALAHRPGRAPAGLRGRQVYNGAHAALAAALGRPSIFGHRYPGLWSILPGMPGDVALYDHAPLRRTLERLVDFDRLNRADEVRFALACTDLETGEDVYFDNTRHEIGPEHVLASAAIAPLFPPVEIDGRLLVRPRLRQQPAARPRVRPGPRRRPRLHRDRPVRAAQPAAGDRWTRSWSGRRTSCSPAPAGGGSRGCGGSTRCGRSCEPDGPRVRLVHLAYQAADHELAAKTLDFSPSSIRDRWAAGRRDMASGLALLEEAAASDGRRLEYLAVDPRRPARRRQPGRP